VNQVEELERSILARAEELANQYRERAKRNRDSILREAAEKRRMRERREEAIAKAMGERAYRQRVQASELKMQSQLDRMRWNLVQAVQRRIEERMQGFVNDEAAYLDHLQALIAAAAANIEADEVDVLVNREDRRRLAARWEAITQDLPTPSVRLAEEPIETLGGVLVRSRDNRIRVDNTFEGRLARLESRIAQVILERLLPGGLETGSFFSG